MSLFDMVSEEQKKEFEIRYPDCGEYEKEELLGFEKEVLGIYLSGHPLEEYLDTMRKNVTATSADFVPDEQTGEIAMEDRRSVVIGGLLTAKKIMYTKRNQQMAFLEIEDLAGSVEVIVFPQSYERYQRYLNADAKLFVTGHASIEEDQAGKVICDRIIPFSDVPKELWILFPTKEAYMAEEQALYDQIADSDGNDEVAICLANPRSVKRLGRNRTVRADAGLLERLRERYGKENVKLLDKKIEL